MAKSELLMDNPTIYKIDWQYDYWYDIESCFPKGSKVSAVVKKLTRNYAFLSTLDGVTCFLDKRNVKSHWIVTDLTEEIKCDESIECTVIDYNFDKKSLTVSLNLN